MSLPKLALTAVFMISVCSPALAENTVKKPVILDNSIVNAVNSSPQASMPQNTRSVRGSRGDRSGVSTNSDQLTNLQTCGSHSSKSSAMSRR